MMRFFCPQISCALTRIAVALAVLALLPAIECPAGPVILATDGSVTYDSTSGDFNVQATGLFFLSSSLPNGNTQVPISGGSAAFNLTVDQSGSLVGNGTFAMNGAIDFDQDGTNDTSGSLLTGTVSSFFPAGAGPAGTGTAES